MTSDALQNKPTTPTTPSDDLTGRQCSGFGPLSTGKPALSIEQEAKRFTKRLRREFAELIQVDAKTFKKCVMSCVRRGLPPFVGRPSDDAITRAIELYKQRVPWKEIYPQCITNHACLSLAERRQAESNLRAAKRSRKNAHRRRSRRIHTKPCDGGS